MLDGGHEWSGWVSYLSFFRHVAKLGIDYSKITLDDLNGRPVHIVENGRAIPELIS